jgi:hypothetical protein
MLNLQLLFPKSQPAAAALAAGSFPTSLNIQPAAGSAAPTAPSDPFARTSQPGADLEAVRAGIRNIVETTSIDLSVAHSIALGNAIVLQIQGTAFMIDKGADVGTALLHIQDQTNTPVNSINVFPGDTYSLPFTFVMIENAAQAAKVLRIHYGTGIEFKPSLAGTLTISGNVSILQTAAGAPQGPDQSTSADHSGVLQSTVAPVAAQFSTVGLINPNGSGKRIYVDAVYAWGGTAADLLAIGFGAVNFGGLAAGAVWSNKRSGGAALSGQRLVGATATVLTAIELHALDVAGAEKAVIFPDPYIIEPNNAIVLQGQSPNVALTAVIVGREY